jgi:hypothetical protein
MNDNQKRVEPIPDEFASYEAAAEFWDTHDTADYPEVFQTVEAQTNLRKRHYEIEVDEDVALVLRERAHQRGVTIRHLASDLLRKHIVALT